MKNLLVTKKCLKNVFEASSSKSEFVFNGAIAHDCTSQSLYFMGHRSVLQVQDEKVVERFNIDSGPVGDPDDRLVDIDFLTFEQSVCAVTQNGCIWLYNVLKDQLELAGEVSCGILTMSWSPDQELVALVSTEQNLLVMTVQFEPVAELQLFTDHPGKLAPVSVGWGSKQTQFHGSEGKQAAVRPAADGATSADSRDDGRVRVCWRGDGQMLTVSAISPHTGVREFVVVSRSGELLCRGVSVPGAGQCISWQPSGQLIASTQQLPNKLQVIFYEKNGLRHGQFTLPFAPGEAFVRELVWSPDSSVLAARICVTDRPSVVQLWSCSNYHWYLKQQYEYPAADPVGSVSWHPEAQLSLYVVTSGGRLYNYAHQWSVCVGGLDGAAPVAVVDGRQLLVTTMGVSVVPPPMCGYQLQLPAVCSAVVLARHDRLYVCTNDGRLHVFAYDVSTKPTPVASIKSNPGDISAADDTVPAAILTAAATGDTVSAASDTSPAASGTATAAIMTAPAAGDTAPTAGVSSPPAGDVCDVRVMAAGGPGYTTCTPLHRHILSCQLPDCVTRGAGAWAWQEAAPFLLVCCVNNQKGKQEVLVLQLPQYQLEHDVQIKHRLSLDSAVRVTSAVRGDGGGCVAAQTDDDSCLMLDCVNGLVTELLDHKFVPVKVTAPLQQIDAVVDVDGRVGLLTLCSQRRLCMNGRQLLTGCNSFSLNDHFLITTTLEHVLRCVRISRLWDDTLSWSEVPCRRLERGSRLIAAPSSTTWVVLQMPRGNLEVIHPRPLVLSQLSSLMDKGEYCAAYELLRRHRVSLNLLVDHCRSTFPDRCERICRSLQSQPNWICVFVSDLSEEDVTQTRYRQWYGDRAAGSSGTPVEGAGSESKVNWVCGLVRAALQQLNPAGLLLPIITTLARQSPPALEPALRLIQHTRDNPPAASDRSAVTADAALKYLLYLVKLDELYNVALGTYDFQLVVMVAEKTQKDPKEYLPFLNELNLLPASYRRYRVDRHLGRDRLALQHLIEAGADHQQEALQFTQERKLYRHALQFYTPASPGYKAVCALYADDLLSSGEAGLWEAAVYFLRAGAQTSALDAFRRALAWRECLHTATMAGLQRDEYRQLCGSLAADLCERGRHCDAAAIYERHLKQPDQQVRCLLQARLWMQAVQACRDAGRPALLESLVRPAVDDAVRNFRETVSTISSTLVQHSHRLVTLRQTLANAPQYPADAGGVDNDLYSDASSVSGVSTSSGRSSKSSKSRRKQERKKYSLRAGSESEDLALVAASHVLITQVYCMMEEVGALLRALVSTQMDCVAVDVQSQFAGLIHTTECGVRAVWPSPDYDFTVTQPWYIARMHRLEVQYRYPPLNSNIRWKLTCL